MSDNDPQTVNQRMGLTVIGLEATDDQVQQATDMADGKLDGLAKLPSTDVGNVLAAMKDGRLVGPVGQLALFYAVARDLFVKGDGHGTASEDIEAAETLGATLFTLAKLLVALLPK